MQAGPREDAGPTEGEGAGRDSPIGPVVPADVEPAGRLRTTATALVVFALVAVVYLVTLTLHPPITTGDEPHYLMIAQSIVHDGDVDLANNYANARQVQAVYPHSGPLVSVGHAAIYRPGGPEVPVHSLGLPVLVAAVYELGLGTFGVRAVLALVAAAIAPLLVMILNRLLPGHRIAGAVSATVTPLVAPMFLFSDLVYPDVPGAFLLTVALTCLIVVRPAVWSSLVASLALAGVPWFHIRMSVLVLPLALALLIRAWRGPGPARLRSANIRTLHARVGRVGLLAVVVAPLAVSGVGVLVVNHLLYGSFAPNAAYRVAPFTALAFTSANVRTWAVGMLFSPGSGVLPLAPVLLIALAGAVLVIARWRWRAVIACAFIAVYYTVSTGVASGGGYCPPGRWMVAFAPAAAIPVAVVLTRSVQAKFVAIALATFSLLASVSAAKTDNLLIAQGTVNGRAAVPLVGTPVSSSGVRSMRWGR